MAYTSTSQVIQPYTNQEAFDMSQLDSAWPTNFRYCSSHDLLPCLHQCSQIQNPICNSVFMGYQPQETWENELGFSAIVPEDSQLQIQSTASENPDEEQGLKQAVTNLEGRVDKLAGLIENLRTELDEKTRFYGEIELYITRLMEWTKDSKQATDSLVAELRGAIDVAKAK